MRKYRYAKKILLAQGVENAENLLKRQDLQIGLAETQTAKFEQNSAVILDFGQELCGGVRILAFKAGNTQVRIRFGESLTECCSELGGAQNATNDHSNRDFTVHLQNYSDMTFGQTGFRFVRLDFYGGAVIKSVVAESYEFQKPVKYAYTGEDALIKSIYHTAKHTVDLCASKGYLWDGVKRDRLVWIGDIHPEMLALTTLYGRLPLLEKSVDFVKAQTPLPKWMNGYSMYSMWWIIIVADYCAYTGALDYAEKQIGYLEGLIEQMLSCVLEDGSLAYPNYFVDWPTCGKVDEKAGVRAINILAAKKAIWLLQTFGRSATRAETLLTRLMKKEIIVEESKQVLGLKYFAVGLNKEDEQKLVIGGAKGMSTFMSYYILKAVASFDRPKAIEMMKEYYGAMLAKGATTFWEDFDLSWAENSCKIDELPTDGQRDIHGDFGAYCYKGFRHSLCHGWSAGVVRFIQEEC